METSVNNKCKAFTSLEQSKKLAEILPLESADMYYACGAIAPDIMIGSKQDYRCYTICWSLAALLEQLPYELCDDEGNSSYLEINKENDVYQLVYTDPHGDFESIETDRYEHFVDACYEMIEHLHELNLL